MTERLQFLTGGGPALWAIAALSVAATALILWKLWRLIDMGAWRRADAEAIAAGRGARADDPRAKVAATARAARALPREDAREVVAQVARRELHGMRAGLRALEVIATTAPLLGLLGTVLGMIAAFRALQAAGAGADPSVLAGGIWEALLTTAAGMAVAIPASVALNWFESVAEAAQADMEDLVGRILLPDLPLREAAE